jgi:hypothetical protein
MIEKDLITNLALTRLSRLSRLKSKLFTSFQHFFGATFSGFFAFGLALLLTVSNRALLLVPLCW